MATNKKAKPFVNRLLVRPSPLKGESLRGYLLRAGECNGCGNGANLYGALTGSDKSVYIMSDSALDDIARAFELNRDQIEVISYRPTANKANGQCEFFGHPVSVNHFRSRRPVVCPECLVEQNAVSGLWDLNAVCACHVHGKWLVDLCPKCGNPLKWSRARVAVCDCGFDLRTAQASQAPLEVQALTSIIHERALNDLPIFAERSLGYPEALRQRPFNEVLALFRYTAEVLLPKNAAVANTCEVGSPTFRKHSKAAVLMAGMLKNWPNELPMALAHCTDAGECSDDASPILTTREFSSRYSRFLTMATNSRSICLKVPDFFRQAMLQFKEDHCITTTGKGQYLNPNVTGFSAEGQRVIKRSTIMSALGLMEPDDDMIVPFSEFTKMKASLLEQMYTFQQACYALDCSIAQLNGLIDLKFLLPFRRNYFLTSQLMDLLSSFEREAVCLDRRSAKKRQLEPLTYLQRKKRSGFAKLNVSIAMQEVRLYKVGQDEIERLSDLYVDSKEASEAGY